MNGEDNDLSRASSREWIDRMLKKYEDEMRVCDDTDEARGAARRARTTIYIPPIECYICHWPISNPSNWRWCSAAHAGNFRVKFVFTWKREPRWFD